MIDLTTDAGYRQIKWVSAPNLGVSAPRWTVHPILHAGDGPLGPPAVISAPVGQHRIHPSEAAEIYVAGLNFDHMNMLDDEIIRIAVHLQGLEFCAFGVVVTLEPTFDAREL